MVIDRLDVAGCLEQGRPAVEHTQRYVRACQLLGYQHPDLTAQPSQIRDGYDHEDGLDLRVLGSDCGKLWAAADLAAEALRLQREQVAGLSAVWTGSGADNAVRFLLRHCDTAATVVACLRSAAQQCESLRDNVWHLLNVKVATVIAIDDRTLVQRPAWLAAAETITTGVGDRPAAEELIYRQVKPYVDNDIRTDWVEVVRSTLADMTTAYDTVTEWLNTAPKAHFEIPGDFGRSGTTPMAALPAGVPVNPWAAGPASGTAAVPVLPAALASGAHPVPAHLPEAAVPPPAVPASSTPAPPADAAVAPTGAGDFPALGGLGGLASWIVAAMSDLLGSAADHGPDDLTDTEDPFAEDAAPEDAAADDSDIPEDPGQPAGKPSDKLGSTPNAQQPAPLTPSTPLVAAPPPVAAPLSGAPSGSGPSSGESTPCQIAADELPQAGQ